MLTKTVGEPLDIISAQIQLNLGEFAPNYSNIILVLTPKH